MSIDAVILIDSGTGPRRVRLTDYLEPHLDEQAAQEANDWIKSLRHARVDGRTFRERFTYRNDSLWWFAELYLHKERAILSAIRAALAVESLIERERPLLVRVIRGSAAVRVLAPQVCAARHVRCDGPALRGGPLRVAAMDARGTALALAAMGSRRRPGSLLPARRAKIAAFVHRAFWRTDAGDGSAESYIGPVLEALERKLAASEIEYIGIGPATNFRTRRWWRRAPLVPDRVVPVESLVPRSALTGSWRLWRSRHAWRRALVSSADMRRAAMIRGYDCWPIVREALAGIALLQFPWSARAMDEAAAAFDVLRPDVALTYAEAGGWGRALALEARRRGIPLAGLQHGFIYRHWLNYRHEPDEMMAAADGSTDAGFPRPALTLLFDEYAAHHLVNAGRFPRDSLAVTGSPRLDALADAAARLAPETIEGARRMAGADGSQPIVLVVSKHSEIRPYLPALVAAIAALPGIRAAIKTHPAETPALYHDAAGAASNVRVLPASAPLAPLLRAARAVVTVNSTVAVDALALGIPALAIGLPNNLSPFVAAGAMAGAATPPEIGRALARILYDEEFRQQLLAAAAAVAATYRIAADGGAAERSAAAILALAARRTAG